MARWASGVQTNDAHRYVHEENAAPVTAGDIQGHDRAAYDLARGRSQAGGGPIATDGPGAFLALRAGLDQASGCQASGFSQVERALRAILAMASPRGSCAPRECHAPGDPRVRQVVPWVRYSQRAADAIVTERQMAAEV